MFPTERVEQEDLLFYAELVGAIDKTVYRLGFPVNTTVALTRYSDIRTIVDKLVEEGIPASDIVVRYKNWTNGGYFNTLNDRVRLVGSARLRGGAEGYGAVPVRRGDRVLSRGPISCSCTRTARRLITPTTWPGA